MQTVFKIFCSWDIIVRGRRVGWHAVVRNRFTIQKNDMIPLPPSSWCFKAFTQLILCYFRVYHSRKFSKCSIAEYKEFLLRGGGACLFNRPTKVINVLVVTTSAKHNENEIVPLKHLFSDLLKHLCGYFVEVPCD